MSGDSVRRRQNWPWCCLLPVARFGSRCCHTCSGLLHVQDCFVLERFALELLIGAHENSERSDVNLNIDANLGNIHLLHAAFYAVKLELQRRDAIGR